MSRDGWILVGAAVLALAFVAGGAAVQYLTREEVASLLRAAFERYGLDPEWGPAFGEVESNLNASARSPAGAADDKLGGAYGATQITATLLRLAGGPPPEVLLGSPYLQAEWTARLVADGACVHRNQTTGVWELVRWGRPSSLEDAAAVWNAGYPLARLSSSSSARTSYVPKILAAYGEPA